MGCCGESWSCCQCLSRCCCKPWELLGVKEDANLNDRLKKATKEQIALEHKTRSFRKGNARMGVCVNGSLGLIAPCYCGLAWMNAQQGKIAAAEQRKIEDAAKANHDVDLRKGEDRVGRKRHLLTGALLRIFITVACCFAGEWVTVCAEAGVTSVMESAGKVVVKDGIETVACQGAKPGLSTATGCVAEKVYRGGVRESCTTPTRDKES